MPEVVIISGANGAGKSTFARSVLPEAMPFLNADEIAKELPPDFAGNREREAARIFFARMEVLTAERTSFALETTLASRSLAPRMRELQAQGWTVHLFYFFVKRRLLCVERVACRVRRGGHDIPTEVIYRRWKSGADNFRTLYGPFVDTWCILGNDDENGPYPLGWGKPRPVHIPEESDDASDATKSTGRPLFENVSEIVRRAYVGVRETLLDHKAAGNAIAVLRKGTVEIIQPEDITVSKREANFLKHLRKGGRVRVAQEAGWRESFLGTVTHGPWRTSRWGHGRDWEYIVEFDGPQHDNSPDGPYGGAQIWSQYLQPLKDE